MDSATSTCLRNPSCYTAPLGEEPILPWLSRSLETVRTTAAVLKLLDTAELARVEQVLYDCALEASTQVNGKLLGKGNRPMQKLEWQISLFTQQKPVLERVPQRPPLSRVESRRDLLGSVQAPEQARASGSWIRSAPLSGRSPTIRLYREQEGERFLEVRDSISICFYLRHSHPQVASAVLRALEVYRRTVGPQTLAWYPEHEGEWQELDQVGWEAHRRKLLHLRGARLSLHGKPDGVDGYEFRYQGWNLEDLPFSPEGKDPVFAVAFFLPTEYLEAHGPAHVRQLALELAAELPFNSGHAGLSIHSAELLTDTTHALIRALCLRHPGLDRPAITDLSMTLGTRLMGAHWWSCPCRIGQLRKDSAMPLLWGE